MPVSHVILTLEDIAVTLPTITLNTGDLYSEGAHEGADISQTHLASTGNTGTERAIEGSSVTQDHLLASGDTQGEQVIEGSSVVQTHELSSGDNYVESQIEGSNAGQTHALSTGDVHGANVVEGSNTNPGGARFLNTGDLRSEGQTQFSYIQHHAPIHGTWSALPTDTLSSDDIFDENDVLAGSDAHESLGLTDARWLRQSYAAVTSTIGNFAFDAGLPGHITVTSIDSLTYSIRARMNGVYADDMMALYIQVLDAGGQPLSTEQLVCTQGTTTGAFQDFSIDWPDGEFIPDPNSWTGSQVRLRWTKSKVGQTDLAGIAVSQVVLSGDYTSQSHQQFSLLSVGFIQGSRITVPRNASSGDLHDTGAVEGATVQQSHLINTGDLYNTGAVEGSSISADTTHYLNTSDLESTGRVQGLAMGDLKVLVGGDLASQGAHEGAAVSQDHQLSTGNTGTERATESSSILQHQTTSTGNLADEGVVEGSISGQVSALETGDLYSESVVEGSSISQTFMLSSGDLANQSALEYKRVFQTHILSSGDLASQGGVWQSNFYNTALIVRCGVVIDKTPEPMVIDKSMRAIVRDLCEDEAA